MVRQRTLQLAVVLVMVANGLLAPVMAAGEPPFPAEPAPKSYANLDRPLRLLSATEDQVTFEITTPWEQLITDSSHSQGYTQVSLAGWSTTSRAGAPMLPMAAQAIAAPFGATLRVQVEAGPAHTTTLPAPVLPVATQAVVWDPPTDRGATPNLPVPRMAIEEDSAVYAGEGRYPGPLAEVASDGMVRQQRVAGIVAYPVQYQPSTRELTVYEWLRIRVTFERDLAAGSEESSPGDEHPPLAGQRAPAESPSYEAILRSALPNYDQGRPWRSALTSASSPMLGEGSIDALSITAAGIPWAPPTPGWRVKVRDEGFYKLTYAELQAAGLPVASLDPRTFRLHNLGSQVAIYVEGEADGKFGAADYILFYGQPVASKYTADNVYWLTYGQGTGLRMPSRSGAPGSAVTPAFYPAQRHMEGNAYYIPNAPGNDDLERWFWDYVYPPDKPSWSSTFTLAGPYAADYPAKLTVAMLGFLQHPINPDHHARILLNGAQVGDVLWDGNTWQIAEMPIAQNLLVAGNNTLSVVCPNDTGVGYDVVYVDWAEIEFANTFRAEGNALAFTYDTAGAFKFQVDGFGADQIAVYNVTNPAAVVRIEGIEATRPGSTWTARFQDTLSAPARYWATASTAYRTVQAIEADTASSLQSTSNGADYIIITHKDFAAQAAQVRDLRASQGLRAVLVDVQDVYDEFGYGLVGVIPIHDFLAYAYSQWRAPAPSFVLLVGDGHYDPKNYAGYGRTSYIPPYLAAVDPWIVETAADNRYVTLVGADRFPDLMLGRLAVNNSAEATAFVGKILAYEPSPSSDWQRQVLAVADNADSAGNYAQQSDNLLSCCLPAPYQASKVYYKVTHSTVDATRKAIRDGISAGKLIVNYLGHGATTGWAGEPLFTTQDVPLLQNSGKLPVMLPMTCYDGYYHNPELPTDGQDALAEMVTRVEGRGAVASWSPTGNGGAPGHDRLDRGFFRAIFYDGLRTLGEATNSGKLDLWASGANLDLLDTYLLFGDPATEMPLVAVTPSADLQVGISAKPVAVLSPGAMVAYEITVTNNGPARGAPVVLSYALPSGLINPMVVSASAGVTLRPGATFIWDIAQLGAGASARVLVQARINPAFAAPGTIVSRVQVEASQADPQPSNNQVVLTTKVGAPVLLPIICRQRG